MAGKTYHTRIPNSTFIAQQMDDEGKPIATLTETLQFKGSDLVVDNPHYIKQLDSIADKPGCPIFTTNEKAAKADANLPAEEVKKRAGDVVEQIAKAGVRA